MNVSPDTLPSLAASEASRESDHVNRALFQTPEKDEALSYILRDERRYTYNANDDHDAKNSISNSSQSTEVTRETLDTFEQLTFQNLVNGFGGTMKDPPDFTTACSSAMNIVPVGLLGMFGNTSNERTLNSSPYEPSPAVTEVMGNPRSENQTWKNRAESLQRECETLKQIINDDSQHILRLKTVIQEQKIPSRNGEVVCSPNTSRIVRDLQDQCELLKEREKHLVDSIEKMKRASDEKENDLKNATREMQRLKLENELFSYQIVEIEQENKEVLAANNRLRDEIEEITGEGRRETTTVTPRTSQTSNPLKAQVAALAAKMSEIENDLEVRERQRTERLNSNEDLRLNPSVDTLPLVYSASDMSSTSSNLFSNLQTSTRTMLPVGITTQDEFEVTLDGLIISTSCSGETDVKMAKNSTSSKRNKRKPRSSVCDCFQPSRLRSDT